MVQAPASSVGLAFFLWSALCRDQRSISELSADKRISRTKSPVCKLRIGILAYGELEK